MSRLVDEYGFTLYDTAIDEMSVYDYQLIGTLRNIKKWCDTVHLTNFHDETKDCCDGCPFYVQRCQFSMLFGRLTGIPRRWDMGRIKEAIKQ